MAILPIYNGFHPVLKQRTKPIEIFDQNLIDLVSDMFETMHYADGIGLAANQVGVSKSVIIIDTSGAEGAKQQEPLVLINPVLKSVSDEETEMAEGCLSIPTFREYVFRPKQIQVSFLDENMNEKTIEADELLSRVMQHEIDHLEGVLFFERLGTLKRTMAKNKLKSIQKGKILPEYPMVMPDGKVFNP